MCENEVVCGSSINAVTNVAHKVKKIVHVKLGQVFKIKDGRVQFLNEGRDDDIILFDSLD